MNAKAPNKNLGSHSSHYTDYTHVSDNACGHTWRGDKDGGRGYDRQLRVAKGNKVGSVKGLVIMRDSLTGECFAYRKGSRCKGSRGVFVGIMSDQSVKNAVSANYDAIVKRFDIFNK